jgi:hypothetical protein
MKRTMFLVLAAVTSSASFSAAAAEPQCIGVTAGSAAQRGRPVTPVFSATQVVDVDLEVLFSPAAALRLTGHHVVEVKIYSPKGNLYQSISIPFSFDRNRPLERRLDDYPEPVALRTPVARTYNRSRHYGVAVTLPVAGTPILNNSLYGLWTATAFIDGARSTCGAPMKFRITQ